MVRGLIGDVRAAVVYFAPLERQSESRRPPRQPSQVSALPPALWHNGVCLACTPPTSVAILTTSERSPHDA